MGIAFVIGGGGSCCSGLAAACRGYAGELVDSAITLEIQDEFLGVGADACARTRPYGSLNRLPVASMALEGGEKTRVLGGGPVLAPLGENIAFA